MHAIGVRAHDYGRQSAEALAATIAADGFAACQLAPAKALAGVTRFEDNTDGVLDAAREGFGLAGVLISVYGCYQEIGTPDDAERARAVERVCAGCAHAARLCAPLIATETSNFQGTDAERERAYERLVVGVIRIARAAERASVTACLEPVAQHTLHSARLARRLLDEVRSDRLKIVLDPVNLLTEDNLNRQDAIWDECFELLGPDIAAVHMKDVDAHLRWRNLGQGLVHYDRIFTKLRALSRDLPLLREGAMPDSTHIDINAMRQWIGA